MKKIVLLFTVLFVGALAQARSLNPNLTSTLNHFNPDAKLGWSTIVSGTVTVPAIGMKSVITLELNEQWECPTNLNCAMVMPEPRVIQLPLTKKYHDSCGSLVYEAAVDKRPVDGNLEIITVYDHRSNTCPTFVPLPDTHVTYEMVTSGMTGIVVETFSSFSGDALK